MARQGTRKPPARERYEQSNPVISCRLGGDLYDQLFYLKTVLGLSWAGLLLELMKGPAEKWLQGYERGYEDGRRQGYTAAKSRYLVDYACCICHGLIEIDSEDEKIAVRHSMREKGWGHGSCVDNSQA